MLYIQPELPCVFFNVISPILLDTSCVFPGDVPVVGGSVSIGFYCLPPSVWLVLSYRVVISLLSW